MSVKSMYDLCLDHQIRHQELFVKRQLERLCGRTQSISPRLY